MKFWPCALILTALLLGGWVATHHPIRPPDPDFLGHFSGSDSRGRELEIVLSASTDVPFGVEGRWRQGGDGSWEIARVRIQRSSLSLYHLSGQPILAGRFQEDRAGNPVLDVGATRLVRVASHAEVRLETPGVVAQCVHPVLTAGAPSLRRAVARAREDAVERARERFRQLEADRDEACVVPWDYSETWNVAVKTEDLVSLFGYASSYAGGAHGNSYFLTRTFWTRGGEAQELRLADLFNPCTAWLGELSDRVIRQVREAGATSVVDGLVTPMDEARLEYWGMSRRGIEFHFEPYALGCYAEGAYYAMVKYEDLREFLNPVGPAAEFLR